LGLIPASLPAHRLVTGLLPELGLIGGVHIALNTVAAAHGPIALIAYPESEFELNLGQPFHEPPPELHEINPGNPVRCKTTGPGVEHPDPGIVF